MNSLSIKIPSLMTAAALTCIPLAATTAAVSAQGLRSLSAVCEQPNAPAMTDIAVPATPSSITKELHLGGTTYVKVDLDANGAVIGTTVVKTSGVPLLDRAALAAARASTFRPEIRDCAPVAGDYLFVVDFPE